MNQEQRIKLDKEQMEVINEVLRWRDQVQKDPVLFLFYTCILNSISIAADQTDFRLSETSVSASALGQSTHKPQEE